MQQVSLDSPLRSSFLVEKIKSKKGLKFFYEEIYQQFTECLGRCPKEGLAVELGSGGGFLKEYNLDFTTSDVIAYDNVDLVVDGTNMPFEKDSLRLVCLLNVLHHIPDVAKFFGELDRCLMVGGRALIVDQHRGFISKPILKYAHHEPFLDKALEWRFPSKGPLSDANGALAWMVFRRDLAQFEKQFPKLKILSYRPHSPLRYWLTGGLKNWNLLPGSFFKIATWLDRQLTKFHENFGSFVTIEIVKLP